MRPATLIAACAAVARAAAPPSSGYLYTIDQSVTSSSTQFIDSDLASSILARRRGLTDSRYLNIADASILDDLHAYGGWQQPLFGQGGAEAPGKLFIRISGFDGDWEQLGDALPDLLIENPTKDLKADFKAATSRREGLCEYAVPASINSPNSKGVEVIFTYAQEDEPSCLPASDIPHIPVILSLNSVLPTSPSYVPQKIGPLLRILRHLSATQNVESTLLILPSKLSKPEQAHSHTHNARSSPEETPFDLPSSPTLSPAIQPNYSTNTSQPLPSAIPACFSSLASCTNTTNACSGHGSCYEAHNNCFRCKCVPTVLKEPDADGDGKKTVQWGGGACEKKDISVPFLLFASIGVGAAILISGSIGMLWGMGSAELPKVLSAGVGGSRPGK